MNQKALPNQPGINLLLGFKFSGRSFCYNVWYQNTLDMSCLSVAAGQHTTLFLAKPDEKLSDLPRHPEVDAPDLCLVCNKDNGDDDPALECDKV